MGILSYDKIKARKDEIGRLKKQLSDAAIAYLENESFQDKFCGDCPWSQHVKGSFDYISSFGEPPHDTCPVDFDFESPYCMMCEKLLDIMRFLKEADDLWM